MEDPLEISPEDLKMEPEESETLEIAQEPLTLKDERDCHDEIWEDVEDDQEEDCLTDVVGSEPCEGADEGGFFFANLGDGDVVMGSNAVPDLVPMAAFQVVQKMYTKAMTDATALTKQLSAEKRKNTFQAAREAKATRILKNNIRNLTDLMARRSTINKEEINSSWKTRVESDLESSTYAKATTKHLTQLAAYNKSCRAQLSRLTERARKQDDTITTLRLLVAQTKDANIKDSQIDRLTSECGQSTPTLQQINSALDSQRAALEKLRRDVSLVGRTVVGSNEIQEQLHGQLAELRRPATSAPIMAELQASLQETNARIEEAKEELRSERDKSSWRLNAEKRLVNQQKDRFRELKLERELLELTESGLKYTYEKNSKQLPVVEKERDRFLEEAERCRSEIVSLESDVKKLQDELVAKQCQYCGF